MPRPTIRVARRAGDDVAFSAMAVNDAVALHVADVGLPVDTDTDVGRDAADIVLLDKDVGVLADGVIEGRRIFANTLRTLAATAPLSPVMILTTTPRSASRAIDVRGVGSGRSTKSEEADQA